MAENQSAQERTEQPTPKRLREAKDRGQVARSRELNTMVVLLAGAMMLFGTGGILIDDLMSLVSERLSVERELIFDRLGGVRALTDTFLDMLLSISPFLAVTVVAAFVGPLFMGGWAFSAKAFAVKPERLNPLSGLKRIFGMNGLIELAKAVAKFVLLAAIAAGMGALMVDELMLLGVEPLGQGIVHAGRLLGWLFVALSAAMVGIVAIDVPYQLWDHRRKLLMTRQEVREEQKETDGNPEVRARVRALQREMSQRRMMEEVPKADVVIVNPTHYSVAIRYDENADDAPLVVAKGTDFVALKIREIASRHGVPIFSAPPLTRALYHSTEVDRAIPRGLYVAVAQVLAYIYRLQAAARGDGPAPERLSDVAVPEEFLPDAQQ